MYMFSYHITIHFIPSNKYYNSCYNLHSVYQTYSKYAFELASMSPRPAFHFFFWKCVFSFLWLYVTPVDPMHCLRDPQTSFFSNFFIKNGSHGIIHTFKIYFTTVFRVFRKIRDIQTDPKSFIVIDGSVVVNFPIVCQCLLRLKMFNEKV